MTISELEICSISVVAYRFSSKEYFGKYLKLIFSSLIDLQVSESLIQRKTSLSFLAAKLARTVPQLPPPRTDIVFLFMYLYIYFLFYQSIQEYIYFGL